MQGLCVCVCIYSITSLFAKNANHLCIYIYSHHIYGEIRCFLFKKYIKNNLIKFHYLNTPIKMSFYSQDARLNASKSMCKLNKLYNTQRRVCDAFCVFCRFTRTNEQTMYVVRQSKARSLNWKWQVAVAVRDVVGRSRAPQRHNSKESRFAVAVDHKQLTIYMYIFIYVYTEQYTHTHHILCCQLLI